jgi:hypothetical protein
MEMGLFMGWDRCAAELVLTERVQRRARLETGVLF